jgi:hypothetical protein
LIRCADETVIAAKRHRPAEAEIRNPRADCRSSRERAQRPQRGRNWPVSLCSLRSFVAISGFWNRLANLEIQNKVVWRQVRGSPSSATSCLVAQIPQSQPQESPSGVLPATRRNWSMKAIGHGPAIPSASVNLQAPDESPDPGPGSGITRGPIEFRFVLKFAAQMSTPCSRGLSISHRTDDRLIRHAPRLFQSHLQRHSVLQ